MTLYSKAKTYFSISIWEKQPEDLKGIRNFFIKISRLLLLTIKNFVADNCTDKAQALTFYTILSIVPLIALIFGISKGFGIETLLKEELAVAFTGHKEVFNWLMTFVTDMLKVTKGGTIAGVGLAFLFWSVLQLISNIESAFNNIWNVKHSRSWKRKFTDYFSLLLFAPILIVISGTATVFISTKIEFIFNSFQSIAFVRPLVMFGIKLIPYIFVWLAFSFIYIIIPNTKIKIKSALIAGVVAGSIFQITQWLYFFFQIGVSKYSAVYGSFAAIPLFLIWMNISWQILLGGAELSYSFSNLSKHINQFNKISINKRNKTIIYFYILYEIVVNFEKNESLIDKDFLHEKLEDIPNKLIDDSLRILANSVLIYKTTSGGYLPSVDINKLTVRLVVDKVEMSGINDFDVKSNKTYSKIKDMLTSFDSELNISRTNILVKDIMLNS